MVAVAGTIRAKGLNAKSQPWAIAIEEPLPDQRAVHRIEIGQSAVADFGDDGRIACVAVPAVGAVA
jgi:thiamine biosynthesis lipoprotein